MNSDLTTALVVSGVGLLMLVAALAILYGLIYAMTALIKDQPEVKVKEPPPAVGADARPSDAQARVAVLAVALARAELESSPVNPPEAGASPSPWEQYYRHRRLSLTRGARTGTSR